MGDRHVTVQEKLVNLDEAFNVGVAVDISRTLETTLADLQQFTREKTIKHISQPKKHSRHIIHQDTHEDYSRRPADHRRRNIHSDNQTKHNLGECFEKLTFDDVVVNTDTREEVYASLTIKLRGKPEVPATVKVKRDTGAKGSVLPLRTYQRMYPTNLDIDGCPMSDRLENQNTILIV